MVRLGPVSIPFIAGQWSLHSLSVFLGLVEIRFQSPSLRGSGRFINLPAAGRGGKGGFQSPSLRGSGRFSLPPWGQGWRSDEFQSPSLRGSGRFRPPPPKGGGRSVWFQSPSLRGSGRFKALPSLDPERSSFNPLHCGAVVASREAEARKAAERRVSIPFIAGQWSLPLIKRLRGSTRSCFNPLHCGAVVASRARARRPRRGPRFQSPSLRGSGRFRRARARRPRRGPRFNPLHCGAVVASCGPAPAVRRGGHVSIPFIAGQWSLPDRRSHGRRMAGLFQSPSLRGSGRFPPPKGGGRSVCMFQSPSLRGSGRFRSFPRNNPARLQRFNPLHCGAVVASSADARRSARTSPSFNPLHCGAVVASGPPAVWQGGRGGVSIPFIAGQWSLLVQVQDRQEDRIMFQSPSLRGSGRFRRGRAHMEVIMEVFQSPSLRGSGRFPMRRRAPRSGERFQSPSLRGSGRFSPPPVRRRRHPAAVSIPFIAGQWSLRKALPSLDPERSKFQSPSLRGSGRFRGGRHLAAAAHVPFQSPSLRGSGRFRLALAWNGRVSPMFQSPSLRGSGRFRAGRARCVGHDVVSIPFIAGQWSLQTGRSWD